MRQPDVQRLLKTQLEVCWNGDVENPVWRPAAAGQEFVCPALAPFDGRLDRFLHTGARQEARLKGSTHTWQGGPVAIDYIRGKYIDGPAAAGGRPIHAQVGERFLRKPQNRAFYDAMRFDVVEPG